MSVSSTGGARSVMSLLLKDFHQKGSKIRNQAVKVHAEQVTKKIKV